MSAKISDLTVSEFRELIAHTVREALSELLGPTDPDAGLELNPQIVELIQRQRALRANGSEPGYTLEEIRRDLGTNS